MLDPVASSPSVSQNGSDAQYTKSDGGYYFNNGFEERLLNNNSADRPGSQNLYSWSMNPLTATAGAGALTTGRVSCYAMDWHVERTIGQLHYFVFTAGSSLTANGNFVALFNGQTGARLWNSADQSTNFAASATRSLTGINTLVPMNTSGRLIVAVLCRGTTGVTFRGSATSGVVSNIGCTDATGYNSWLDPATGLTVMPTTITPFPVAPTLINTASFCVGP